MDLSIIQNLCGIHNFRNRWCSLLVQGYHWQWELDLQLWPWDKATVLMEKCKLTKTEKSERWRAKSRACSSCSDIKVIVHKEFALAGQTVNSTHCCDVLRWLRENVRRLRPKLWRQKSWMLHHDNAPSHTSIFIREYLTKITWLSSPTHPTCLTCPLATFLFPWLKKKLKDSHFDTNEVIKAELQPVLNTHTE
jgi:hypothetical protein